MFYALTHSDRPFAASLLGIHIKKLNVEQEVYLSSDLSTPSSENSCEKSFAVPSCDPRYYSTVETPTPPPRVRRSWLPPLKFQAPLETDHPALRSLLVPSTAASQTNLLPSPIYPSQATRSFTHPGLSRSHTAVTAASSIYSRETTDSTCTVHSSAFNSYPSTLDSYLSSMSSLSLCSHPVGCGLSGSNNVASSRPSVPAIPEEYRHRSHSLRDGGSPVRPGSRPCMPPAGFWEHISAEQQRQSSTQQKCSATVWPGSSSEQRPTFELDGPSRRTTAMAEQPRHCTPELRRTETVWPSTSPEHWPSAQATVPEKWSPYRNGPLLSSPDKAILRTNINKSNVMKVGKQTSFEKVTVGRKRSYEHMRKESQVIPEVDYCKLQEPGHKRKDSRTLVKQRQPWDPVPRHEREKSNF